MAASESNGSTEYRGNQPKSTRDLSKWYEHEKSVAAIDPRMPIVDAHHHVFGSADDMHYYRIEDLARDLDSGHRIIGTVYIEAYESGWRTTGPEALRPVGEVEMIMAVTQTPVTTKLGGCQVAAAIVCHADLALGDGVAKVLRAQVVAGQGRLRGVRQRAATASGTVGRFSGGRKPHLLSDPAFRLGFAQLDALDLSFDAWVFSHQLPELIDLSDAFPDTTIVVDHLAAPIGVAEFRPRHDEVVRAWKTGVRALAQRPNVRMKVGGMGMAVFGFGFEHRQRPARSDELARAWKPYIDACVDAFGTNRCMFESNFPVDKQSCSYGELWNAFKLVTHGWSPDERRDLFYRTACKTYRLPALESLGNENTRRT